MKKFTLESSFHIELSDQDQSQDDYFYNIRLIHYQNDNT